jgi:hypothetical protein
MLERGQAKGLETVTGTAADRISPDQQIRGVSDGSAGQAAP